MATIKSKTDLYGAPTSTRTGGDSSQGVSSGAPGAPGGAGPTGIPAPQGATQGTAQQQGTGFINLQQMLDANKADAAGMAGKLTDKANQLGQDASSTYNNLQGEASQKYNDAQAKAMSDYNSQMADYQKKLNTYNDTYGQVKSNPLELLANPGVLKTLQDGPGAPPELQAPGAPDTISGNVGAREWGALQEKLNNASGYANSLKSPAGLGADLKEAYGGGQSGPYTSGMASMDAFLAGNAPGAQQAFQTAQAQWGGLSGLIGQDSVNRAPSGYIGDPTKSAPLPAQAGAGGVGGTRGGGPVGSMPSPQPVGVQPGATVGPAPKPLGPDKYKRRY